jgi:hypothetical protein
LNTFKTIFSAHTKWLTQHADVADSDVDEGTEAVGVEDLAEEAARMKKKNGFPSPNSVVL